MFYPVNKANRNKDERGRKEQVMKKKILSVVICMSLAAGLVSGCGSDKESQNSEEGNSGNTEDNKITMLLDDAATQNNFQDYLDLAEEATGLEIEVIAMPTNTADRTARVMTVLSSQDDSIDIISVDQEMVLSVVNTESVSYTHLTLPTN